MMAPSDLPFLKKKKITTLGQKLPPTRAVAVTLPPEIPAPASDRYGIGGIGDESVASIKGIKTYFLLPMKKRWKSSENAVRLNYNCAYADRSNR